MSTTNREKTKKLQICECLCVCLFLFKINNRKLITLNNKLDNIHIFI